MAESYLQEDYRNCGIDPLKTFSMCVSDSHIKCCSGSNSNGTKSLPDMGDDYITSSCLSSRSLVNCHVTEFPEKIGNNLEGPNKSSSKYLESDHWSYRVLPKDSVEVFKTRKINAMSNKSKWITDNLESSSFLEYSNHTIEIKSSQDNTRRRRKKTTTKRVMIPDNILMNEILSKSYARTHGIMSYSDITTRNILESVHHVKSPVRDAGSLHDNSLLRTVSYSETGPGPPPTRGETNSLSSFVIKSPLTLQVSSKTQPMKAPSTIIIDLEQDVSDKRLKCGIPSNASQEPVIKTKLKSNTSNKPIEVISPKAHSHTSLEPIETIMYKSLSNTSCTNLARARSVVEMNKTQSKVILTKSGSKISQNILDIKESKALTTPQLLKSTRLSRVSLCPVEVRPSRNESQKLLNTIPIARSEASQKLPHGSKTSPSSATIILSKHEISHQQLSGRSLNEIQKKSLNSILKPNISIEENSSQKVIIMQANKLEQNISQDSIDNSSVNNDFDESHEQAKIPGPKISSSSDSSPSHISVSKFHLSNPEVRKTIHKNSSHHFNGLSEFLNSNVVDQESSPATIMAESESKCDEKAKESKKSKELKKPSEKRNKAAADPEAASSDPEGDLGSEPEGKKGKEPATRGPLAHPPAVIVPGKPRCALLVKYTKPPHYKPNSPIRPRSPGIVPVTSGSKKELQAPPEVPCTLPAPDTMLGPGVTQALSTQRASCVSPAGSMSQAPDAPPAQGTSPAHGTSPAQGALPVQIALPAQAASPAQVLSPVQVTLSAQGALPAPVSSTVLGVPPASSTTTGPGASSVLPSPGTPPASTALTKPGLPPPGALPVPDVPPVLGVPLTPGSMSPPMEARYATTDKAMQFGSMRLCHTITQTYDYDRFSGTTLVQGPSRHEYFSGSRPNLNLYARSVSRATQPTTRLSASILSTNTIAHCINSPSAGAPTIKEEPARATREAGPTSETEDPAKPLGLPLESVSTLQLFERASSVRIPSPHEKVDYTTPCPCSPLPCPHSPSCNPPDNIPCYTLPKKQVQAEKSTTKKNSHCKLKPCMDLAALEREKAEIERKFKALFAAEKNQRGKCTSMCKTPPCYVHEPPKRVHTGTVTQPKCASLCKTSPCNPKCRDWATKMQVSQQVSLASVHFADDWQQPEDYYDDTQEDYDTEYCDDIQCEASGFYKDASMRTDFEEKVIKVDKGLNYKQVPIYEQDRIYGPLKQGASLNLNSALFPGYDYTKNQDPYYESGQNYVNGYGLNYERAPPNYAALAYDPNCDRQYTNYSQYKNYTSKKSGQFYEPSSYNYGQTTSYEPCKNMCDHCSHYGQTYDQMPRYENVQTCDQTQHCQYYDFEDQSASEDVEEDDEKCYHYSIGAETTRRKVRVYKDNCTKSCSYKPETGQNEIEVQTKKQKPDKSPYPEYVIPRYKHPCNPIEFGKYVCPPSPCPPAKQCPITCSSRGKISGIHLRQDPIPVIKKKCDPTCKAWNTVEQSSKKDFSIWNDLGPKDDLITVKSVDNIVNVREQPGKHKKSVDPDRTTLLEKRDYVTHHSTPVLNNVFEMKQPVTVNDMTSVGKILPEAKKEDVETSLTNMFEINFNLRVTRGDKTTEISIANEDDPEKIKTPKGSQELLVMKGESPKVIEENPPNDINIRIMIKSYKPKSEKPVLESTVNDFSKEISKKFHTVSTGSKLTGTEEMADHVYSVHRATINLVADCTEASKNESENKDQIISSKILFSPSKVTEKGDIELDKESKTVKIESKPLSKIDQPGDANTEILDTYQEVTMKFSDKVKQYETADNINVKCTVTNSTAKCSSLQNMDLHSILKKDESDLKLESSHMKVMRLYKSDANICETDTEPDVSSYNKTSTERTEYDNKTSDDNLNVKSSEDPALEHIMLALKTSTEPTSESQQGIKENEANISKEDREILQDKKEMVKAIFEKASCLKKSKGKNRIRKLKEMLKAVLTSDSSDPDDMTTSSNYVAKDLTYQNLKTNFFKDSDSLNNYLKLSGKESVVHVQCNTLEAASNASGGDSEWSLETGEMKATNQCICSAVAARFNMDDLACCCQKYTKTNQQISCDLMTPLDEESSGVECVDVQIQNNYASSKIVISQSVEIAAPSSNFLVINNPIVAHAESMCLGSKRSKEKKLREVRIKRSKMSLTQSGASKEYDLRRYNKSPKLGISDNDKIIFLETQPAGFTNILKGSRRRKEKVRPLNLQQPADILQLYETKKAVLEIYTEKTVTENGERLVAKLPKFVYEKEGEIYESYNNSQSHCKGFRSLCKTNIVMMSITR